MNTSGNIPPEFIEEVKRLRAGKMLHGRVCSALVDAIRGLFPDLGLRF